MRQLFAVVLLSLCAADRDLWALPTTANMSTYEIAEAYACLVVGHEQ